MPKCGNAAAKEVVLLLLLLLPVPQATHNNYNDCNENKALPQHQLKPKR